MVDILQLLVAKTILEKITESSQQKKIIFGDLIPSLGPADAIVFARSQPYHRAKSTASINQTFIRGLMAHPLWRVIQP